MQSEFQKPGDGERAGFCMIEDVSLEPEASAFQRSVGGARYDHNVVGLQWMDHDSRFLRP